MRLSVPLLLRPRYEQGKALWNIERSISGQDYADAFMKVFEKNTTPQLVFGVNMLRKVGKCKQ